MNFQGTFQLKLINRQKGETMRQDFRALMKVIYLGACAAYLAEVIRQVPVLTGASRTALLWRLKEIIQKAKEINPTIASRLQIPNILSNLRVTGTLAKSSPHSYPNEGWNESREKWKRALQKDESINLWDEDNSHPNGAGTYLAACVFLGILLKENPVGLEYTINIPKERARFIQEVAWETVCELY